MRIYSNFKEMHSEVGRDLVELGTFHSSDSVQGWKVKGNPLYDMKEIIGYSYKLESIKDAHELFEKNEWDYLFAEVAERVCGQPSNPGKSWEHRREVWEPMLDIRNRFDYTYSERIAPQLNYVVEELEKNPNSRQGVILIYDKRDRYCFGGVERIPCSLSYQFLVRGGYVHIIYNMRSCDYFTHFKFDSVLAYMLMDWMAIHLKRLAGTLTHNIGSLHCFRQDWEKAKIF